MILRARHLFLAWFAYGALQLALLGVGGVSAQVGVGSPGARTRSEIAPVAFVKRALSADVSARHTSLTPFAPSEPFALESSSGSGRESPAWQPSSAPSAFARRLPPARAPPAHS